MPDERMPSWRSTGSREAIEHFVSSVTTGPRALPPEARVAVFDNDGTLWGEKPMPTQLHYLMEHWRAQLHVDPSLANRQPYAAIAGNDLAWIGGAIDKHYAGDDSDLTVLIGAIIEVSKDLSVDDYAADAANFYRTVTHPTLGRPYSETVYQPMVELVGHLQSAAFTCYIVTAGERDFIRPIAHDYYGILREHVIGSAFGLSYDESTGDVRYGASLANFDDGPEKPARIWSRIGRRPILAVGNANGDIPMLDYARHHNQGLALLVHHDDDSGRGDPPYEKGAEEALTTAASGAYTLISVKDDWGQVLPERG